MCSRFLIAEAEPLAFLDALEFIESTCSIRWNRLQATCQKVNTFEPPPITRIAIIRREKQQLLEDYRGQKFGNRSEEGF